MNALTFYRHVLQNKSLHKVIEIFKVLIFKKKKLNIFLSKFHRNLKLVSLQKFYPI